MEPEPRLFSLAVVQPGQCAVLADFHGLQNMYTSERPGGVHWPQRHTLDSVVLNVTEQVKGDAYTEQ